MTDDMVVGLLGFGEVGSALAEQLSTRGNTVIAWDTQFCNPTSMPSLRLSKCVHVEASLSAADLSTRCDVVISAVTAGSAIEALKSCAFDSQRECFYLDLNSVSPKTKRELSAIATQKAARFVEAAVMSPINPKGMSSPILLGGPSAYDFQPIGESLGFSSLRVSSKEIGQASATKMCRSVLIKGVEALVTESMITANYYGVVSEVLDSLQSLLPRDDWPEFAHYMMSRSIEHGVRRSEEMLQAALTVRDTGLTPLMTQACADRQRLNANFEPSPAAHDFKAFIENLAMQIGTSELEDCL